MRDLKTSPHFHRPVVSAHNMIGLALGQMCGPHSPEEERIRCKEALFAAAVPHWFDPAFLAAILQTSLDEAAVLHHRLDDVWNIEPHPARGTEAFAIHETARWPLREHLRYHEPVLWNNFSVRARAHVQSGTAPDLQIEAIFHLFAIDPSAAVQECECSRMWSGMIAGDRSALRLALWELDEAGLLDRSMYSIGSILDDIMNGRQYFGAGNVGHSEWQDEEFRERLRSFYFEAVSTRFRKALVPEYAKYAEDLAKAFFQALFMSRCVSGVPITVAELRKCVFAAADNFVVNYFRRYKRFASSSAPAVNSHLPGT